MAIYVIGDVQGCVAPLEEMLDKIHFEPGQDQLWLAGDLVNRGQHSLETLRLMQRLGDSVISVLGNHDLHLLAVAAGVKKKRPTDTLDAILKAPDRDELLDWLRHCPLVHWDKSPELGTKSLLVHAGIYPGWRRKQVVTYAAEVEKLLRGDDYHEFLRRMYGSSPTRWSPNLSKWQRARFIINVFTRMRYCDKRASLDFNHAGAPGSQPRRLMPWFEHPQMKCKNWQILFGHWSALGFFRNRNIIGLDSGCAWGHSLSAVRLDGDEAGRLWQLKCQKKF